MSNAYAVVVNMQKGVSAAGMGVSSPKNVPPTSCIRIYIVDDKYWYTRNNTASSYRVYKSHINRTYKIYNNKRAKKKKRRFHFFCYADFFFIFLINDASQSCSAVVVVETRCCVPIFLLFVVSYIYRKNER